MEFETEEQQVEALKKWWKENAKQVIAGVVIGFGLIIGWRYYQDYNAKQLAEASALFEQASKETAGQLAADKEAIFTKVQQQYKGTPYVAATGLALAKQHYEAGEKLKAIEVLDAVIAEKGQAIVVTVAKARKARILIDLGKADEALIILSEEVASSFSAIYEELKGDAYVVKGETDNARNAYDKALLMNNGGDKRVLQMKRDNLGVAKSESAA